MNPRGLGRIVTTGRFSLLWLFFGLFLTVSFLTRTVLSLKNLPMLDRDPLLILQMFGTGLFFDVVTMLFGALPIVLYLMAVPSRIYYSRVHRFVVFVFAYLAAYLLIFLGVVEYFFFAEFETRFNFIAVDYLIYTHEVLRNIQESYPVSALLASVGVVALIALLPFRRLIVQSPRAGDDFRRRIATGALYMALPFLALVPLKAADANPPTNSYAREISSNGIYKFIQAFRNNSIEYERFYATVDDRDAFSTVRSLLREPNSDFTGEDLLDITREIRNPGQEKRLNVVVIIVESLSAEFLGIFGNRNDLTPNLDRLSRESMLFTNFYATGTRTDRGLEAITLSVPPTPGRSVVKREDNGQMLSWGSVMRDKGYDTKFLYGGYGYFDNMNHFFSRNGYTTIDRRAFSKDEIHFENAWGICDEDLFDKALSEFSGAHQRGRPFFAEIMTTSNHRPYTYPEGRIDIPPHTGRAGAVKYADYAIGRFIRQAKQQPWFKDTMFVVLADHCASSAGRTALPVKRYHIPLIVYAPGHVAPRNVDTLSCQVDVAPTVLGLLNFSYKTTFFGRDVLRERPDDGIALIGTYERLGFVRGDRLIVLDVKKRISEFRFERDTGATASIPVDGTLLSEAIGVYQASSYLFSHGHAGGEAL